MGRASARCRYLKRLRRRCAPVSSLDCRASLAMTILLGRLFEAQS